MDELKKVSLSALTHLSQDARDLSTLRFTLFRSQRFL